MPIPSARTLPLLRSGQASATPQPRRRISHQHSPNDALPQRGSDASDVPDRSYWTAYDHFMVEREARAMRRAYVWTLLARIGSAFRRR